MSYKNADQVGAGMGWMVRVGFAVVIAGMILAFLWPAISDFAVVMDAAATADSSQTVCALQFNDFDNGVLTNDEVNDECKTPERIAQWCSVADNVNRMATVCNKVAGK